MRSLAVRRCALGTYNIYASLIAFCLLYRGKEGLNTDGIPSHTETLLAPQQLPVVDPKSEVSSDYHGAGPKRTQDENAHHHMHWDPGGVRPFRETTPPDHVTYAYDGPPASSRPLRMRGDWKEFAKVCSAPLNEPKQIDVRTLDEGLRKEYKATLGPKNKSEESENGLSSVEATQVRHDDGRSPASENSSPDKVQEPIGAHGPATMKRVVSSSDTSDDASSLVEGFDTDEFEREISSSLIYEHDSGEAVMPCFSIPTLVRGDSYVLGLRPSVCSEMFTQLDKAEYVTGMLPFMK